MNSVLEVVRAVPELRTAIVESRALARRGGGGAGGGGGGGGAGAVDAALASSLADLFARLESSPSAILPEDFIAALRAKNPMFGERSQHGGYKQHDSEEFFSQLAAALAGQLTAPLPGASASASAPPLLSITGAGTPPNVMDTLFGIEMEVEMTCKESAEEPPVRSREGFRKLMANIDGGAGRPVQVNTLGEGVALGLSGDVEKRSERLGRNAVWAKTSRIARLPKYLFVHLGRFFWKATGNAPGDGPAGVPCKILKPVSFPGDRFDVADFCAAPVKAALFEARKHFDAAREAKLKANIAAASGVAASASAKAAGAAGAAGAAAASAGGGGAMEVADDADLQAALRLSMAVDGSGSGGASNAAAAASSSSSSSLSSSSSSSSSAAVMPMEAVGPLLPPGFLGYYELFGVVTHKGRDSKSGHYISFVRSSAPGAAGASEWLIFDDETVMTTDTRTVTDRLKGGGDDDMAYMLFFRAKAGE